MSNSWQHLTAEEFFSQNNWTGKSLTTADKVIQEIPWLCQKIEEFFSQSNWQGEILAEVSRSEFSLTLSVAGFFQLFAWESGSEIASLPKLEPLPEFETLPDDELKLDDFGSLF